MCTQHASNNGLRLTVHAGETVGPEGIWGALRELKPDRIGHGLHAIEDPELVRYMAEKQIPIEICITSNIKTGCCRALEEHPVRKLFDAGVAGRRSIPTIPTCSTPILGGNTASLAMCFTSATQSCRSWRSPPFVPHSFRKAENASCSRPFMDLTDLLQLTL